MVEFSTKAKVLEDLTKVITAAKILPLIKFSVNDFVNSRESLISKIQSLFKEKILIIRSSSVYEDNYETSNAGKYKSILNIDSENSEQLISSIQDVINSYESKSFLNEIFIQPQLDKIKIAGVVVTADIDTLSPYYIVNYDESGSTDTVTNGKGKNLKTNIRFRYTPVDSENDSQARNNLDKLFQACKECEIIFNNKFLDIEFAFDQNDDLFIFQVRPIVIKNKDNLSEIDLKDVLEKIYKKFKKLSGPHPNILGNRTIFGVMPDWNPAEIIGIKPKRLSLSLYKELITDNIWAFQRDNYGYRNLRSYPLLISFLGIPYIDVRVSFNSFVPKSLNEDIAEKLVNFYLDKLATTPHLHDKVEFEIVHSCYYLNLSLKLKELLSFGFNQNEINKIEISLLELTNNIISANTGLYKSDLLKIEILKERFDKIVNSDLSMIDKIYWLVEDCKRYGTLPFAGVARAAFIAVQFLKSFIDLEIISKEEYENFMKSLTTISKELNKDLIELFKENITIDDFLSRYGHLRPGTYDILSNRYDESFDNYFGTPKQGSHEVGSYCCLQNLTADNFSGDIKEPVENMEFEFNQLQMKKIDKALVENKLQINANELIFFIKEAIQGREYLKFIFTRSLSQILIFIEEFSSRFNISRDESAFLDIKEILNMYATLDHRDVKEILQTDINKNINFYNYTKAIKLPGLIVSPNDIYDFFLQREEPNFITLKRIEGEIVLEKDLKNTDPYNKIVFIRSADPGYDFLFTKNIAGLVTLYGGVNSHMAIRCAEIGLPAVIGSGEFNFNEWSKVKVLEIDCANKNVRRIF